MLAPLGRARGGTVGAAALVGEGCPSVDFSRGHLDMATLENPRTGTTVRLASLVQIGRDRGNFLQLTDRRVSGSHARITWSEVGWRIRDLGSRNGTYVAGARVGGVDDVPLVLGATVGFGTNDDPWVVTSLSPPEAIGLDMALGTRIEASAGMLSLPDAADPELILLLDHDGQWILESEGEARAVADQEIVVAAGRSFRVYLPVGKEGTMGTDVSLGPPIQLVSARFRVSQDQEHVEVTLIWPGGERTLEPRSFHYMLYILAQLRLSEPELPPGERGWVYPDVLARKCHVDRRTLNVHLWRARHQLADTGVVGAEALIERRSGTQQVRLNIAQIEILKMS